MNPREGTVPLINFPGQDTCAVCSSGYRVTADGKCENANMLYWCLALGFFPPESWRLGDSQDVFFFFNQEEWIFINTHAERRWDIWLGNEATSGWEASIRGFQGKVSNKKEDRTNTKLGCCRTPRLVTLGLLQEDGSGGSKPCSTPSEIPIS